MTAMAPHPIIDGMDSVENPLVGIHVPLLAWYDRAARTLPWRSLPTPYRVWVSEIMLQQTRVEAALPYFERFVAALPTVEALAAADEGTLMKLWEGLGYYSRVRNMRKAACAVVQRHGGELPGTPEALSALPGIGGYTAGAIASIAFNFPVEAVDGNVLRVVSRLLSSSEDVSRAETKRRLASLVRAAVPGERPGDFNQALMDLGATVCVPASPRCAACPLSGRCLGFLGGTAAALPVSAPRRPRVVVERTVFVVRSARGALLMRRPPKGLLAGLWELPGEDGWMDAEGAALALARLGAPGADPKRIGDATHIFTHLEWRMQGWLAEADPFAPEAEHAWADGEALRKSFTLPSAFKAFRKFLC